MISGEKARQIADVEVAARHLGIGISEVVLYDAIMG
jgi:hypothetical protein